MTVVRNEPASIRFNTFMHSYRRLWIYLYTNLAKYHSLPSSSSTFHVDMHEINDVGQHTHMHVHMHMSMSMAHIHRLVELLLSWSYSFG